MIEIAMEVDDEFWNIINQLKEFKGQKEIIHCKDCKYWQEPVEQGGYKYPSQCTRDERAYMEECAILMDADDFCSRGERKGD